MTQGYTHPIAPLPELTDEQVGEWLIDDGYPWDPSEQAVITITSSRLKNVARQAAQWGADQELEACCEWLKAKHWIEPEFTGELRAARRPKPPSLKEQALEALDEEQAELSIQNYKLIRAVLEQLDD